MLKWLRISKPGGTETYASKINVVSQSNKELQAQKMLESTTKFTGERYEVGMLWGEPEPNQPNNYSLALGQLYSLEQRLQRDPNLKSLYQQSIDTDVETGFVKILDESQVNGTFGKEWYLPHHPVLNPKKHGKVRRVCNAALKYKVCPIEKLLAGPDLLQGLIRLILRFFEGPIALTADIESMFLQVQVPEQDRSCLSFLWRPRTDEPVQIYDYQRQVFGAMSSSTCSIYALKRVGHDIEEMHPTAAKAIQNNFYMDDFIKSVVPLKKQTSEYRGIRTASIEPTKTSNTRSWHWRKRKSKSNIVQVTKERTVWWRDEISKRWKGNSKRQ